MARPALLPLNHPPIAAMYEDALGILAAYGQPTPDTPLEEYLRISYSIDLRSPSHRYGMLLSLWLVGMNLTQAVHSPMIWKFLDLDPVSRHAMMIDIPLTSAGMAAQVGEFYGGDFPEDDNTASLAVAPGRLTWTSVRPPATHEDTFQQWTANAHLFATPIKWLMVEGVDRYHARIMWDYPLLAYCRQVTTDLIGRQLPYCIGGVSSALVQPATLTRFHEMSVAVEYHSLPQHLKNLAEVSTS